MTDIIKLVAVISLIVIFIVKKWKLEYAIFIASLLLGIVYQVNVPQIFKTFLLTITDEITLRLIGIIILVYIFSGILTKIEGLSNLINSLRGLFKDYRIILAFIPALLGLIPMPAGAMFSAPMVKKIGEEAGLNPEENTFINYWFRHIWEPIWPMLPALLLFITLLKVSIGEIIRIQFPLFIATVVAGLIWEYKTFKPKAEAITEKNFLFHLKNLWLCIWPIIFIIFLVIVFKVDILASLSIVIIILLLVNKDKLNFFSIKEIIKNSFEPGILILIMGVMFFQKMLITSRAIEIIPEVLTKSSIPAFFIVFGIPLIMAIITGISSAPIGIALPLLLPVMIINGELNLQYAMLFFSGQFIGLMLSPMHLCLMVSKDYFEADLGQIYKILLFPLGSIALTAFILVMIYN
ncbi:MAG: TIGR00529 family membrane protein [Candidatus Caldatribacteriota bacterium]